MKKIKTSLVLLLVMIVTHAQSQVSIDERMNNTLRESGKLYVVIAILITIFAAILVFLIRQEIKIKRIENQIQSNKNS